MLDVHLVLEDSTSSVDGEGDEQVLDGDWDHILEGHMIREVVG